MSNDASLRDHLVNLLTLGEAHVPFEKAVKNVPVPLRGKTVKGADHTLWELLEHLRITQRDILNFSSPPTGGYHAIEWPDDYWSKPQQPTGAHAWDHSVAEIHRDLKTFIALIENPSADLYKPFRWGDGQNLLREALLIADHTAYHLGELVVLRRLLGAWHK